MKIEDSGYQKTMELAKKTLREALLFIFVLLMLIPILWVIVMSLKTNSDIFVNTLKLPNPPVWENYTYALKVMKLPVLLRNTLTIAVVTLTAGILMCLLSSFAISRMRFGSGKLQNFFYIYFISGIITPVFVLLFPIYIMNVAIGVIDTLMAMILPYLGWFAPMGTLIMVGAFKTIPTSIEEAAIIDGCETVRILFTIDAPIIKPTIATVLIVSFLGIWNEFPLSVIMLTSPEVRTIPLAASMFMGLYTNNYGPMAAAIAILTIPQLTFFAFFQRFIIDNISVGAVKG